MTSKLLHAWLSAEGTSMASTRCNWSVPVCSKNCSIKLSIYSLTNRETSKLLDLACLLKVGVLFCQSAVRDSPSKAEPNKGT